MVPPKKEKRTTLPPNYAEFLSSVKERIRRSRLWAYRSVNRDLIDLYWNIGQGIVDRQEKHRWGKSAVERPARDLRNAFPEIAGFSAPNLW